MEREGVDHRKEREMAKKMDRGAGLARYKLPADPVRLVRCAAFSDRLIHSRRKAQKEHWMNPADIVRYWRSVELLQPQAAPKSKKRDSVYEPFIHDTSVANPVMPWDKTSVVAKEPLPNYKEWSHLLFAHCYDGKHAVKAMEEVFGADQGCRSSKRVRAPLETYC